MSLPLVPMLALALAPTGDLLPFPLDVIATETITSTAGDRALTQLFTVNQDSLQVLLGLEQATLTDCALISGELVTLELERLPITTEPTLLFVDGKASNRIIGESISLWSGHIAGAPDSDVFLSFSPAGTRGWISTGGENSSLMHWIAEAGPGGDWSNSLVRTIAQQSLGLPTTPGCLLEDLPNGGVVNQSAGPGGMTAPPSTAGAQSPTKSAAQSFTPSQLSASTAVLTELPIAVETDYQFFQLFGSLPAAESYAVALMGAISARYREQVDLVITLPYLGLYTNAGDPWNSQDSGGTSIDLLYEFQSAWFPGTPSKAALGHFLSGASLGGGVAWLDTVCMPEYRFGVTGNLSGATPFPVIQGPINWDFTAAAHEIGHNLATHHTHNYCPPLDECAPSGYWGPCQTQVACISNGTIMSYCHLCSGGGSNITTYFHPTVVQTIRARVANSCLRPFEGAFTSELAGGMSGSSGLPTMEASYSALHHKLQVDFGNAPNPETGFLVVGAAKIDLPLFGGTLVPSPDIVKVFPVSTMNMSLPPADFSSTAFPLGIDLFLQGWFTDTLSPTAFAATSALAMELFVPAAPPALIWYPHPTNGKEYAVTPPGVWHKGEALAIEYGGHLVSMADAAEEAWLKSTFFTSGLISGGAYIGLTDEDVEGSFQWSSGAFLTHSNWASGEPNNSGGFEDYAEWSGGSWNDVSGYSDRPGLIQRP